MSWEGKYVGLPYAENGRASDGADCWGLACLVYAQELGILLPAYVGAACSTEVAEIAGFVEHERMQGPWIAVGEPRPFDLLVFRRGRYPSHIGIATSQPSMMLHMDGADQAKIVRWSDTRWSHRFIGPFRHLQRALKGAS